MAALERSVQSKCRQAIGGKQAGRRGTKTAREGGTAPSRTRERPQRTRRVSEETPQRRRAPAARTPATGSIGIGRSATSTARRNRRVRRRPRQRRPSVRGPTAPGAAPPLRRPPRSRRRVDQLGGAEGPDAGSRRQTPRRARRGPPARVLRLRRRDPRGRVRRRRRDRVGLGHVDAGLRNRSRSRAIDDGDLHFDLHGEKLHGRFVLVRGRGGQGDGKRKGSGGKEQWLMLHKHDGPPSPGGTPRTIRVGEVGTDERRGEGGTGGELVERQALVGSDGRRTRRVSMRSSKSGDWQLGEHTVAADEPRQGAVPGAPSPHGDHQAGPDPLLRQRRAGDAAVPRRSTGEPASLPRRDRQEGLLAQGRTRACAGLDRTVAQRRRRPRRDRVLPRVRHARGAGLGGELRRDRDPSVDVHRPRSGPPDLGDDRHRSGDGGQLRRRADARPAAPRRARPPRRAGGTEGDRQTGIQIWVPVADRYTLRRDPRTGSSRCPGRSGDAMPEMVSWEWEIADRHGLTRLDYTQNAVNKTLVAPFSARPAPGAPVSVPITWDELDDPDLRPDRWTIADVCARIAARR